LVEKKVPMIGKKLMPPSKNAEALAGSSTTWLEAVPESGWRSLSQRITARLPVYLADFRQDPKWLIMFVAGRFTAVRSARACLSRYHPPRGRSSSLFPAVNPSRVAECLRRNGIYQGIELPSAVVERMRAFAERTLCYGDFDRDLAFLPRDYAKVQAAAGRPILVGHYLDGLDACADAAAIRNDPVLIGIAGRYLNAQPIVISSRMWWSFPAKDYDEAALKRASQNRFHFDMNDWRSLKFFFYLTDVDVEAGPHVFVRESHRKRRLRHQFTPFVGKSHADILDFYGADRIVSITGRAGLGFAEDPFGFHMGTVAKSRPRLMFEVEFGISRPTRRRYYGDQETGV
jgi:hypothetical protein